MSGRPLGIFTCDCGFIYQRIGPDNSKEDRFTYNLVREYGRVWENKLRKLWSDLSISAARIATTLGVSSSLIVRHAIRLNLPMNETGTRTIQGYERHRNPNETFSKMKTRYRQNWLKVLKANPTANRKALMKIDSFHYLWLRKHDLEWFEKNIPKPLRISRNIERLNWQKIDEDLSKQIAKACEEIRAMPSRPQRVSITEILRRVGHKHWIEKRHLKLPRTTKVIIENLESLEDYMIRKLHWAQGEYLKEEVVPSRNQLIGRAVANNKTTHNSERIQREIDLLIEKSKHLLLKNIKLTPNKKSNL